MNLEICYSGLPESCLYCAAKAAIGDGEPLALVFPLLLLIGPDHRRAWAPLHFGGNQVAFTVVAKRSGLRLPVPVNQTILQVLQNAGVEIAALCESVSCGTCITAVLEGVPDHRDQWQTSEEKTSNKRMTVCC